MYFVARQVRKDGTTKLGTLDSLSGTYKTWQTFRKYQLERFGKVGQVYETQIYMDIHDYREPIETRYGVISPLGYHGGPKEVVFRSLKDG